MRFSTQHSFLLCISLLMYSCTSSAQDTDRDCIFDPTTITEDFLKEQSGVEYYTWDDDRKVARVLLEDSSYVYVKKWACTSRGMICRQVFANNEVSLNNKSFWMEQLLLLGQRFLKKWDYEDLEKAVKEGTVETVDCEDAFTQLLISINSESYSLFEASVQSTYGVTVVSVEYHMN